MATLLSTSSAARDGDSASQGNTVSTQAFDRVFAEMSTLERSQRTEAKPANVFRQPAALSQQREAARDSELELLTRDRKRWLLSAFCLGCLLLGVVFLYLGSAGSNPFSGPASNSVSAASTSNSSGEKRLRTSRIDEIRVGDRLAGHNPIREQVDLIEPDPATWRKVSLQMSKDGGLGLWIELLRPLEWVEGLEAKPGDRIYLDLEEMGAVGWAEVLAIGPCPAIEPGSGGTIVTGTFKHEADKNSKVVHLKLEDQSEPTGVTANHPYWSIDRQDFVEVGSLRAGELVDTAFGLKRVVSVTPIEHNGFLYNVETTEHVYRVGSLGTLVHNSCVNLHDIVPYSKRAPGFEKHHALLDQWAAANKLPHYTKSGAPTIVMSVGEHNATRRVFGQWRYERTGSINGAIDWAKVTPREIQTLNNRMLEAANIPQAVRDSYMQALNRFLYTGNW